MNFKYFKEVFVLSLVSVNLQDIFYSIQELVERCLVLQDEHVVDVKDCSSFMWQVFCKLIYFGDSLLNNSHFLAKLRPALFALQYAINDTISSCFVIDQPLLDQVCVVTVAQSIDIFLYL